MNTRYQKEFRCFAKDCDMCPQSKANSGGCEGDVPPSQMAKIISRKSENLPLQAKREYPLINPVMSREQANILWGKLVK